MWAARGTDMNVKTVLVADDEAHILHLVAFKLAQAGLRVITAADGEEAYEMACEHTPDLVVTDLQMPLLSGIELGTRLRSTESTSRIPVLMVTARPHLVTEEELSRTNIRAVMCKPFSPREFLDTVQGMLGQSGASVGSGGGTGAAAA